MQVRTPPRRKETVDPKCPTHRQLVNRLPETKNLCSLKNTVRTVKRRATEWPEIFTKTAQRSVCCLQRQKTQSSARGNPQPTEKGRIPGNASRSHSHVRTGTSRWRDIYILPGEVQTGRVASNGTPVRFKIKPLARSRWARGSSALAVSGFFQG